jgi:hypothetical protein
VLNVKNPGRPRTSTNENSSNEILSMIENKPILSIREIEKITEINKSAVLTVLRREKFKPYKVQTVQRLITTDFFKRYRLCSWMMQRNPSKIFFSDKCLFSIGGKMNKNNIRFWAKEKPEWIRETSNNNAMKVMTWMAISGEKVIGPYFFDTTVTKESYLEMLEKFFIPSLNEITQEEERENVWFQQDGASAHYANEVRNFLNITFPNKWIGRGGPVEWPARSPDLNPLDFFLRGYIKSKIYTDTEPVNIEDLKNKIRNACEMISPENLWNVQNEFRIRINKCFEVNGEHFEHLL